MRVSRTAGAAVAAVLIVVALVVLDAARKLSITYDERAHIGAAFASVHHGEILLNPEQPPLVKLVSGISLALAGVREESAAPHLEKARAAPESAIYEQWPYGNRLVFHDNADLSLPFSLPGADSVVLAARAPLVVFPLLLCLFAFLWARSLFGTAGGFVALGLAATYPDVLGHGALVGTDVPVAAFALGAGYALDGFLRAGGAGKLVLLGLTLGGAMASKFSGAILAASFGAATAVAILLPRDPRDGAGPGMKSLVFGAGAAACLAFLVVAATYLGAEPISAYRHGMSSVTSNYSPASRTFCLGTYAPRFWYYFPVVAALKLPLGTLALLALTAIAAISRSRRGPAAELPLHLPPAVLLVATSALGAQNGSRYLLPVVSFLLVSAGRLGPWAGESPMRRAVVALAMLASLVHVAREHPFHTSSTNALAGDPRLFYRLLDDSNQDWGQGLEALAAWQRARAIPLAVVSRFPTFDAAELPAYGVEGRAIPLEQPVMFAPEENTVYAISAHIVSRGKRAEMEAAGRVRPGYTAPRQVLGGLREPDEIVGGGYLIFDLREAPRP